MNRPKVYHPPLPFPEEVRSERLPEPVQKQCQQLLSQMLREVAVAKPQIKEGLAHE
ncbi:MAG TPA: hypothetical protein VLI39_02645 [Sedimentisphaerales bacterium]|jgi:hypothetical protein|nr:hypothetical protein [Sedimentisphaerales bacterium]